MKIQNPYLRIDSTFDGTACAGFYYQGARFHIWINRHTRELGDTLYKNCPLELKRGDPGYYQAKKLDPKATVNAKLLAELMAAINWDVAEKEAAERTRAEEAKRAADAKEFQLKQSLGEHGPVLLEAIEGLLANHPVFRSMPVGSDFSEARRMQNDAIKFEDQVRTLIKIIKGE